MNYIALGILLSGGIILTIGDIIMKKWVTTDNMYYFLGGIVVYLLAMILLGISFKFKNIAVASMMITLFNVIILVAVSWLYFDEKLSIIQLVGIIFGIISIVLLEMS